MTKDRSNESEDRALLEAAARAAGIEGRYFHSENPIHCGVYQARGEYYWNPLVSDSEALRLAVKLRLRIEHDAVYQPYQAGNTKVRVLAEHQQLIAGSGSPGTWAKEFHDSDPQAATRRAIVRAAAAIRSDPSKDQG